MSKFVVADVERQYGLDLQPNLYVEYENKPAIIAQAIALAPEPGQITDNPSRYYGKAIAVAGEIKKVESPNLFTLDDDQLLGANDLLVLNVKSKASNQIAIQDGETVAVTGVLRPFVVAEFERDYDLSWDLDLRKKLEAEYQNKPVLVAEAVYPSAIPEARK